MPLSGFIKWKCKNWIVYFKKFDNFHLIHLIVESWTCSTFTQFFSIVITNFTLAFLKKIHQKWKYYREQR